MSQDRIYLRVPFDDKELAKSRGCRWDSTQRLWYCTQVMLGLYPDIRRWLPPGDQRGWKAKPEEQKEVQLSPSMEMLRRLIQLCHPDKHNGSEASAIATKYLLELKEKAR